MQRSRPGVISEARRLRRNATSAYANRALMVLSVLLLTPYLFAKLGLAGFGAWSVMFTVVTVFNLFEVGFLTGVTTTVARLEGARRTDGIGAVVRAGALLMAFLGLLALAVAAAVAFAADGLAAEDDRAAFRDGLVVLGGAMLVRLPCAAFGAALQGRQRYDLFNAAEALAIAGFAVGAVVALESGGGLVALAVAQALALVAGGLLFVVLLYRASPGLSLRGRGAPMRGLAGFGSWTLLAGGMSFVAERMDTVVVAAVRGAAAAGPYAAAQKLRSGLQSLTLPILGLLLPMVSELDAAGRRDEVARRLVLATRVALQATLPVAAALALFAADFIGVWLGSSAPASTASIVAVLMAVEVLALLSTPSHYVLVGLGRVRVIGILGLVDAPLNLTLSIILVSEHGAIGAAWATLLTSSLLGVVVKVPLAARASGATRRRVAGGALTPALVASLPALAAMVAIRLALDEGLVRLALGVTAGVGIAAAVAIWQIGPGRLREVAGALRSPPDLGALEAVPGAAPGGFAGPAAP
ncbi:MAG: lipopolysaccharide biosynthesis protein [Thermoleophilia bacterium]